MNQISIFITTLTLILSFGVNTQACGSFQGTVEDVKASPDIEKIKTSLESLAGLPLTLSDVIYSGSSTLNFDKVVHVQAMCEANYYNLYFSSPENPGVICLLAVEPGPGSSLSSSSSLESCRMADGKKRTRLSETEIIITEP